MIVNTFNIVNSYTFKGLSNSTQKKNEFKIKSELPNDTFEISQDNDNKQKYFSRFKAEEQEFIKKSLTQENMPLLQPLLIARNNDRKYRFTHSDIAAILDSANSKNIDLINFLLVQRIEKRGRESTYRYNAMDIRKIALLPDSEESFIRKLSNMKVNRNCNELLRFDPEDIVQITKLKNKDNTEILDYLLQYKDPNGRVLSSYNLINLAEALNLKNFSFAKELLDMPEAKTNLDMRFDVDQVITILQDLDSKDKNIDFLHNVIYLKDDAGSYKYNSEEVVEIFDASNPNNESLIKYMIEKNIDGYHIGPLAKVYNSENGEFIKKLLNMYRTPENSRYSPKLRFRFSEIVDMASMYTEDNKSILDILVDAKLPNGKYRFKYENIKSILAVSNQLSITLIEKLLAETRISKTRGLEEKYKPQHLVRILVKEAKMAR